MDRREKNIEIFHDTERVIQSSSRLKQAITDSVAVQKLYHEADEVEKVQNRGLSSHVLVSKKRSLEAASAYARAGEKVAVLNFASATNPGGGVTRGSSAQEECICRCSTLYSCLNIKSMWDQFYTPHRSTGNPLYNDDCLYTPELTVFKSDTEFPETMDEKDWYSVDVITCAAPNLRERPENFMNPFGGITGANIDDRELYELHLKRIDRIFSVAAENRADVLVLGAFGCGAFCNPPEIVAKAFRTVQEKYAGYFKTIEYAVYCGHYESENYETFHRVLQ